MAISLSQFSVPELKELLLSIPAEIKRREESEKAEVLNELRALAKARGYAMDELLGKEVKIKLPTANKVKAKYRHPQDASLEWTGRGRTPKWVEAWVAAGGSMEQLLI